jgi:predicted Zn-dependent peptidase
LARTILPSGVRIVTEEEKSVRSAAFGIWVNVGSRDESNGIKKRSSLAIFSAIEAVGGETNAFTSKEYTCFYARVIDKYLPLAVDVICDLITSSVIQPVVLMLNEKLF